MCAKRVPIESLPVDNQRRIVDSLPKEDRRRADALLDRKANRLRTDEDGMILYDDGSKGSSIRELLRAFLNKNSRESIPPDYHRFLSVMNLAEEEEPSSSVLRLKLPDDWIGYT